MSCPRWFVPPADGGCFAGVISTFGAADGCTGWVVGSQEPCVVLLSIPVDAFSTLFGFQVVGMNPLRLQPTKDSKVLVHQPADLDSCTKVAEVCAGLGGIGIGASQVGFSPMAFLDKNELCCSFLRRFGHPIVHCADLCKDKDICSFLESFPEPIHVLAAGFSCQPFSFQGDQAGFGDTRASSFWGTLRMCYLGQFKILVLECTTGAGHNHALQTALAEFAEVMNFQCHQLEFNLSNQWPCQRLRWWAVLYPRDWPSLNLRDWDIAHEHQQVVQIMPTWPSWTDTDLQQLILSPFEVMLYFEEFPERDGRIVRSNGPLPCFLHSYGNATGPCPCECRTFGFKLERLRKAGLRGILICHQGGYRFLHPLEVAYFVGMPLDLDYGSDQKAALCLLGQIASPLQSLWLFAHIRGMLNQVWGLSFSCKPLQEVYDYKLRLIEQHFHCLPSVEACTPHFVHIEQPDGQILDFLVSPGMTVQDLCNAERINLLPGEVALLFDGDRPLPPSAFLRSSGLHGTYKLRHVPCSRVATVPQGLVCVSLTMSGLSTSALIPAGSFLFDAEDQLECTLPAFLIDERGLLWRPDDKVWQSVDLSTNPLHGSGPFGGDGLSLDFVVMVLRSLAPALSTRPVWTFLHCMVLRDDHFTMVHHSCDRWQYALDFGPLQEHLICLLVNGHWIFVRGISSGDAGKLWLLDFDGLAQTCSGQGTQAFVIRLQDALGLECILATPPRVIPQTLDHSCGTIMLLQLAHALGLLGWDTASELESIHGVITRIQAFLGLGSGVLGFGAEETQATQQLLTLLIEKGVPRDRAEERAMLGIKKIGLFEVQQALANKNPWNYLKAVASRPHVAFQWLRADELQGKIQARAKAKFQIQPSQRRKKDPRPPEQPLILDPAQLNLVPNTFFAQGKPLPQIPFSGIGNQAWGIAFGSVADMGPYLQEGKVISDKPLGVLTTAVIPADQVNTLQVESIRFPALYKGTNEPLLIMGSLVTLGKIAISRADQGALCTLQSIPTQTLRLAVFKDQWTGAWEDFIQQPLRSLLLKIPTLCLCKQTGCGVTCPKFHADLDEPLDQLIMDVWSRSFHHLDTKFAKPRDSALWTALVRVPQSANLTLQALSGKLGLYVEPRSESGKEADPDYGVIWLGNISLQDAHHRQQTTDKAIAVCRINNKYGLRVHVDHLEATHKHLKPEEEFAGNLIQEIYKIYPLPWGTQRAALQKCLTDWGWKAKVLQTVGGGSEGLGWEVGSRVAPPSNVLQFEAGDAVITHLRSATKDPRPPPILASLNTKKHIQQGSAATSSDDPWGNYQDPWAQGRQIGGTSAQTPSADRFQQMETRLNSNLREVVRKEIQQAPQPMEDDTFKTSTEERFARIETSLTEMQAQHVKYEGWFAQMHQTDQFLTAQIQDTNQRVETVRTSLESEVSKLSDQVSAGFNNIEALLAKRNRTE